MASNAVIDALSGLGVTHVNIPFTPEKKRKAIQEAGRTAQAADYRNRPALRVGFGRLAV